MYFVPPRHDYVCLNYSESGIFKPSANEYQHYVFTSLATDEGAKNMHFDWKYGWYDVQNSYLFCNGHEFNVLRNTSFSMSIYPLTTASDYDDEKYASFQWFVVNLNDHLWYQNFLI